MCSSYLHFLTLITARIKKNLILKFAWSSFKVVSSVNHKSCWMLLNVFKWWYVNIFRVMICFWVIWIAIIFCDAQDYSISYHNYVLKLQFHYWKCNFSMSPHVRLSSSSPWLRFLQAFQLLFHFLNVECWRRLLFLLCYEKFEGGGEMRDRDNRRA